MAAVTIPFPRRPASSSEPTKLKRAPADIFQELAIKSPPDLKALALMAQALLQQGNR